MSVGATRLAAARGGRIVIPLMTAATEAPPVPTLDERLVGEEPELVKQSLTRRRAAAEQITAVDRIAELTKQRTELVQQGNVAREVRKKLSPQIGKLLKEGKEEEVAKLKEEVAE